MNAMSWGIVTVAAEHVRQLCFGNLASTATSVMQIIDSTRPIRTGYAAEATTRLQKGQRVITLPSSILLVAAKPPLLQGSRQRAGHVPVRRDRHQRVSRRTL